MLNIPVLDGVILTPKLLLFNKLKLKLDDGACGVIDCALFTFETQKLLAFEE